MFPTFKIYYQNFALDNATVSLTVIIWAICLGLAFGVIAYTFSRHSQSKIVEKLFSGGHTSEDDAVTVAELGLKNSRLLRSNLKDHKPLRKYIVIANPDECRIGVKKSFFTSVYRFFRGEYPAPRYDLERAKLYMPEEATRTARARYASKGSPYPVAIIFALLFILCAVGITLCMPKLLELVDTMITAYKNL